jgi:galactonate dehydratase
MQISSVTTFLTRASDTPDGWTGVKPFLFVKIATDAGIDGWGEAYALDGRERVIERMIHALAGGLAGAEAPGPRTFRTGHALRRADRRTGLDFYCATSALEIALWDLAGKRLGAPVHELLGGALRTRVPLYANIWNDRPQPLDAMVRRAEAMRDRGFTAIKIYPMQYPRLDDAEACVRRIREALGPDMDIMIDMVIPDDPHLALEAGRRFEPYRPFWIEEPAGSEHAETLKHIRARLGTRVVTGERDGGKERFREILQHGCADVLNPDIAGCGGILEILEIAAMAQTHGVAVSPHCYDSTAIGFAAMLHACALFPNMLAGEFFPAFEVVSANFAQCDFTIADGAATLPRTPGLGVTMDETALAAMAA